MTDINIRVALGEEARRPIRDYLLRIERDDLADRIWWSLEDFCVLFFRLKYLNDTADMFPSSKGATLEVIEALIAEVIQQSATTK